MTDEELLQRLDAHRHWIVTVSLVAGSVAVVLSWFVAEIAVVCAQASMVGVGACLPTLRAADFVVRLAAAVALAAFGSVLAVDHHVGRHVSEVSER